LSLNFLEYSRNKSCEISSLVGNARGAVRFYPRGAKACGVQLTISYEVPDVLAPFASGVSPLVESILQQDLNRFAKFAKSNYLKSGKM
jgi:uncharacterized membrane protein